MERFDVIVIGGGAGGIAVALRAAKLGLKVALIDKNRLSGDGINDQAVASKALLHCAEVAHETRQGERFGVRIGGHKINFERVREYVRDCQVLAGQRYSVEKLQKEGLKKIYFGAAKFLSSHEVEVDEELVWGKKIVIATGSCPLVPVIEGLPETGFVTTETVFSLTEQPKRLVVLGGDAVALEYAQAFSRLGTRVTLVNPAAEILPGEEPVLTLTLHNALRNEGIEIINESTISRTYFDQGEKIVFIAAADGSERQRIVTDEILVAAGRAANLGGLVLENARVAYSDSGVTVNAHLRTTARTIWALGEVTGTFYSAQAVAHQAEVVLWNMIVPLRKKQPDYAHVPACVFTDPGLARVGATEEELKARGVEYRLVEQDLAEVERAVCDGLRVGVLKIFIDKKGLILGAHMLAKNAGELIQELVLAMRARVSLEEIAKTGHIYPTLVEVNRLAGAKLHAETVFSDKVKKWVRRLF